MLGVIYTRCCQFRILSLEKYILNLFLSGEKDQYYSFLSVTFGMVPTTHDVLLFLSPTLPDVSLYNYMISFPGIPFRT